MIDIVFVLLFELCCDFESVVDVLVCVVDGMIVWFGDIVMIWLIEGCVLIMCEGG